MKSFAKALLIAVLGMATGPALGQDACQIPAGVCAESGIALSMKFCTFRIYGPGVALSNLQVGNGAVCNTSANATRVTLYLMGTIGNSPSCRWDVVNATNPPGTFCLVDGPNDGLPVELLEIAVN